jgi:hypothetical protein
MAVHKTASKLLRIPSLRLQGSAVRRAHARADHRGAEGSRGWGQDGARKHGISEATFYDWKGKYGGMDISEAKRLRVLED